MGHKLGPIDTLFLARRHEPGVTLIQLERELDGERLRSHIADWVTRNPRLRRIVRLSHVPGRLPAFVDDGEFDVTTRIEEIDLGGAASDQALLDLGFSFAARPLDPTRILWRVLYVRGLAGGRAAVAFSVHHMLADYRGSVELFGDLLDGIEDQHVRRKRASRRGDGQAGGDPDPTPIPGLLSRARAYAGSTARVTRFRGPQSTLLRKSSDEHVYRYVRLPMVDLKAATTRQRCTLNELLLASLLVAVARYHELYADEPAPALSSLTPVGMDDHPASEGNFNRVIAVDVQFPGTMTDPTAVLEIVRDKLRDLVLEPALGVPVRLVSVIARLPMPVLKKLARSLTSGDIGSSNVPGWLNPVTLLGVPVTGYFAATQASDVPVFLCANTYAGEFCGVLALNSRAVRNPDVLYGLLQDTIGELCTGSAEADSIERTVT